jgi:hypothetical protein
MIKYDLKCDNAHVFETWFKSSAAYDEQAASGIVACAICGSNKISKAPMAPSVPKKGSSSRNSTTVENSENTQQLAMAMNAVREMRKAVEENCDYVGPKFAEEARKIHYGETDKRGIYGEATAEESNELREEGVEVAEIPWLPDLNA